MDSRLPFGIGYADRYLAFDTTGWRLLDLVTYPLISSGNFCQLIDKTKTLVYGA